MAAGWQRRRQERAVAAGGGGDHEPTTWQVFLSLRSLYFTHITGG